jgi:hypothetical protein
VGKYLVEGCDKEGWTETTQEEIEWRALLSGVMLLLAATTALVG